MFTHITRSLLLVLPLGLLAAAEVSERDFSGNWNLDLNQSKLQGLPANPAPVLSIRHQGATLHCTESGVSWSFRTDGTETKYRIKEAAMSSESKWEGSALLTNTLVSGPQNYVIEDRWKLSRDNTVLTITRLVRRGTTETESVLVYENAERFVQPRVAPRSPVILPSGAKPAVPATTAAASPTVIVKAGTKIPLALINSLSTKHTSEGDRVYLETVFPITQDGRIVIPKGSFVAGTVTEVKRAGRVKGKAELFLRFDSLTLPNGVTRDFRSRLGGSDTGDVDRQEGKIRGESNKGGDAKTVGEGTAVGASVGTIAGSVAGHPGMGAGIGAATGAAAGLAGVLLSRGPDLILPKGTTVEMVLDRAIRFEPRELGMR
ncbi:MAG: hypothetical protein U0Q18_16500 [Bryobacteraceae bacterium]